MPSVSRERAAGPVGGDQVPGAEPGAVTGSTREKLGVNAVLRLAGTHQFGVEAHVDAGVDRGLAQQRLKEVLGEQAR
jgi:hypothetical protein